MDASFFAVLFSVIVYGVIHSLLASFKVKSLVESRLGKNGSRRFYRLFYNLVAVVTFLPLLALVALFPGAWLYRIPAPWVYLTLAVQILSVIGLLAGVYQTGALPFMGISQLGNLQQPAELVQGGLYRWMRHPLYVFGFIFLWLVPAMTWNTLAFNIAITLYLVIGAFYEERKMLVEFGEQYQDYRRRTPIVPLIERRR
jgi:methanethiol S-methyltransferase